MSTYLEIQNAVTARVIDAPTAVANAIPDLINKAIKRLEQKHNFWIMEATQGPLTTTVATRPLSAGVPSDFKDFRGKPYYLSYYGPKIDISFTPDQSAALDYFGDSTTVNIGPPQFLLRGEPSDIAGTQAWAVYPYPDGNSDWSGGEFRVYIPYWKFLADLAADADTNWFTVNAYWYIVYQSVAEAYGMDIDNQQMAVWAQLAKAEQDILISNDKRSRISQLTHIQPHGGALGPRASN